MVALLEHSDILRRAGLSEKEAKVYLAALELGAGGASEISERAAIKRPTTYNILKSLIERGLVSTHRDKSGEKFRAVNPYSLLKEQQETCDILEKALPSLLLLNKGYGSVPSLEIRFGGQGIRKTWDEYLSAKNGIHYWADQSLVEIADTKDPGVREIVSRVDEFEQRRIEKRIPLQGLIPYEKDPQKQSQLGLAQIQREYIKLKATGRAAFREIYFVPRAQYSFLNEISLFDDSVAIVSYAQGTIAILHDVQFAATMRGIFSMGVAFAKTIEKTVFSPEDQELYEQLVQHERKRWR